MAKKTTVAASRPFVSQLTSNLKTLDGRPRNLTLGAKTLVVGPNGSGKSSIQQSLQLALIGSADDLVGRDGVRDNGLLMSMVTADRLAIHAKLSSGEDYTFIAKDSGRPTHDAGIEAVLPLHQVREVLEGSAATARKAFLGWAASSITAGDVTESVSAVYRAKYADISASVGRGKSPVDALLATLEYVGKRQRDASKEASGAEALLTSMAHDLEEAPTEEMVAEADTKRKAAQRTLAEVRAVKAQAAQLLTKVAQYRASLTRALAQPPTPASPDRDALEFYSSMATGAGIAVARGLDACPLCSSAVGASHLKVCAEFYRGVADDMRRAPATQPAIDTSGTQAALKAALEELSALPAEVNADEPTLEREAQAAEEAYLETRNAAGRWASLKHARDTVAEMTLESETYKGMKKELEGVVAGLLKRIADGFVARVQANLPKDWKFGMLLEDNGKETFRLGLWSGKKLRSALSGAEWAAVTCALAMTIAADVPADRPVLVMPEDRGWDAATLGKVLTAWSKFEGQVVIGTPTKPKKVPAEWTVIELGGAVEEEPVVETAPAEVVPQIVNATFSVYNPSPTMRAMLLALGYSEQQIAGLDAARAANIVATGTVAVGEV